MQGPNKSTEDQVQVLENVRSKPTLAASQSQDNNFANGITFLLKF